MTMRHSYGITLVLLKVLVTVLMMSKSAFFLSGSEHLHLKEFTKYFLCSCCTGGLAEAQTGNHIVFLLMLVYLTYFKIKP